MIIIYLSDYNDFSYILIITQLEWSLPVGGDPLRKGQYLLCDLQGGRYDGASLSPKIVLSTSKHRENMETYETKIGI